MTTFLEFFAGGGMARAGLGEEWSCLFSNDFDPAKTSVYVENWGRAGHLECDIACIETRHLPGHADLAWASFPCQDLSLAGAGAGLAGQRSGAFWPFLSLMKGLGREGRAPRLIVLENVLGALSSHAGKDFSAIGTALAGLGYRFGALVMNADAFLPQSRPRLFIIAMHAALPLDASLTTAGPELPWHPPALVNAFDRLPTKARRAWHWWTLPQPEARTSRLADMIEDVPAGVEWHSEAETRHLLALMSPAHLAKVDAACRTGIRQVGTIYRRTRKDPATGEKLQRAEIRFDDTAGCLRTPGGGSSRQIIMVIDGSHIRSRLLSPREAARLMGLPETYRLPANYNAAYHLAGDGVAVPVVRHLAKHLLEPLLAHARYPREQAA